jgi:hypothetical protein
MTPTETEVAQQLTWVLDGHPIDVTLTAIAEALARVIAAQDCEADAALDIVERFTHEWLASKGLRSADDADGPALGSVLRAILDAVDRPDELVRWLVYCYKDSARAARINRATLYLHIGLATGVLARTLEARADSGRSSSFNNLGRRPSDAESTDPAA